MESKFDLSDLGDFPWYFIFKYKSCLWWFCSFPCGSAGKESACNAGDPSLIPRPGRSTGEGIGYLATPIFSGFPCGSTGKESACNVGDLGSVPRLERSPGEGKGYPLQYSGLENSMNYISMGSQKVGHDWATFTKAYWKLSILKKPRRGGPILWCHFFDLGKK